MNSTLRNKLYRVIFLLSLLFISLVLGFFWIYQQELKSSDYISTALSVDKQITTLKEEFWELRFWERVIAEQSDNDAEKEFGNKIKEIKSKVNGFDAGFFNEELAGELPIISELLGNYETTFNSIIQLRTEQGLTQTLLNSNYYSLSSILKDKNEISLLKIHINLGRYHNEYLTYGRETQYLSIKEMNRILEKEISLSEIKSTYLDYTTRYIGLLDKHLKEKKEIGQLNDEFDIITLKLIDQLSAVSTKINNLSRQQIESRDSLKKIIYVILGISLVIEGIFLMLIFNILNNKIIKPIWSLSGIVDKVREGNLNVRFESNEKDEISQLGFTLNDMLKTISESQNTIKNRSKELEKSQRELQNKNKELEKFNKLAVGRELKMIELKDKVKELENKIRDNS